MSAILSPAQKSKMTLEEFLALPDDGTDRWFIDGEVWPRERTMTVRNRAHTQVEAKVAYLLIEWLMRQTKPRGKVHSGEAGFRLRRDPDILVGVDVAYVSAELAAVADPEVLHYDGPPVLAVEILSPSDRHKDVAEKVELYLKAGSVAWVVDPDFQTVRVHRPGQLVEGFNISHIIDADSYMPGLRVAVAAIFEG